MSDYEPKPFYEVVRAALDTEMASRGGGFVTGLCGVATVVDEMGEQGIVLFHPDTQPITASLGMAEFLRQSVQIDARQALYACDEDEDD